MIDGLKLTLTGEELRARLEERVRSHEQRASRWTHERERTDAYATEEKPLLPDQICEYETERHNWRAEVLTFIRDHIDASETYRLDAADLEFAELLPDKPRSIEQEEYEEQTRVGFSLERLAKSASHLTAMTSAHWQDLSERRNDNGPVAFAHDDDDYTITRLDIDGGPEIVKIERK